MDAVLPVLGPPGQQVRGRAAAGSYSVQQGEQQEQDAREEDRAAGQHDPENGEHPAGHQEQGTYLPRRVSLATASGMRPGADPALGQWPGQSPVTRDGPGGPPYDAAAAGGRCGRGKAPARCHRPCVPVSLTRSVCRAGLGEAEPDGRDLIPANRTGAQMRESWRPGGDTLRRSGRLEANLPHISHTRSSSRFHRAGVA